MRCPNITNIIMPLNVSGEHWVVVQVSSVGRVRLWNSWSCYGKEIKTQVDQIIQTLKKVDGAAPQWTSRMLLPLP
jgi:hypothetical protein